MVSESLTASASIYLKAEFEYQLRGIAFFLSFTAFLVVPFSYIIDKFFNKLQERLIIFILMLIGTVSCFIMLFFSLTQMNIYLFYFLFSIIFIVAYVLESFTSTLLAKMFPPGLLSIGLCNAGFAIIISTTGGKLAGAAVITILGMFAGSLGIKLYGLFFGFFLLITWFIYMKYPDLRVKAITRVILRKKQH